MPFSTPFASWETAAPPATRRMTVALDWDHPRPGRGPSSSAGRRRLIRVATALQPRRRTGRTACVRAEPSAESPRAHRLPRLLRLRASSWSCPFVLARPDALVRARILPAHEDVSALVVFVGREGTLGEAAVEDSQRRLVDASPRVPSRPTNTTSAETSS